MRHDRAIVCTGIIVAAELRDRVAQNGSPHLTAQLETVLASRVST
jgi:hypothetical protein